MKTNKDSATKLYYSNNYHFNKEQSRSSDTIITLEIDQSLYISQYKYKQ